METFDFSYVIVYLRPILVFSSMKISSKLQLFLSILIRIIKVLKIFYRFQFQRSTVLKLSEIFGVVIDETPLIPLNFARSLGFCSFF